MEATTATLFNLNTIITFTTKAAAREVDEYFRYNDHHAAFKQAQGRDFEPEDPDDIRLAAEMIHSTTFRKWCSVTLKKMGEPLWEGVETHEVAPYPHDGWKPVGTIAKDDPYTWSVASGWTRTVLAYLQDNEMDVEIVDMRENLPKWREVALDHVNHRPLRDDQVPVIQGMLNTLHNRKQKGHLFHNILLDIAVNTGKTYLAGAVVRATEDPFFVFPFREKDHATRAVVDYLEMGFEVRAVLADMSGVKELLKLRGIDKKPSTNPEAEITICMVQTVMARVKRGQEPIPFHKVKAILFDECDAFTGPQAMEFLSLFKPGAVIGMSGTTTTNPVPSVKCLLRGMFGSERIRVTTKDNVEAGISIRPEVIMHHVAHHIDEKVPVGRAKQHALRSNARRDKLLELVRQEIGDGKQVVVYFGNLKIEEGNHVQGMLERAGFDPVMVFGEVEGRALIWDRFNKREINLLLANRVLKRGVNIPALEVWVQWDTTASETDVVQATIGRGTRRNGDATSFRIHDFMDTGAGMMALNALKRIQAYRKEEHAAKVSFAYDAGPEGYPVNV